MLKSELSKIILSKKMDDNMSLFKKILINDDMVIYRILQLRKLKNIRCCLIYIDGMVNNEIINENIINPIMNTECEKIHTINAIFDYLKNNVININEITSTSDYDQMVGYILYGDTILLIDGIDKGFFESLNIDLSFII